MIMHGATEIEGTGDVKGLRGGDDACFAPHWFRWRNIIVRHLKFSTPGGVQTLNTGSWILILNISYKRHQKTLYNY